MSSSLDTSSGREASPTSEIPEDESNSRRRHGSYSDIEVEVDPEVIERMSVVESKLLEMFASQDDEAELPEKIRPHRHSAATAAAMAMAHQPHAFPCRDTFSVLPSSPSRWPQQHLMIRPTPNTTTKIRGIRYSESTKYQHFRGFCAGCILPINNGKEAPGKSLVIDFESTHFVGTLLMRIKQAPPAVKDENSKGSSCKSYFDGKKRKFQAIVKGRFKSSLPMSQCVTGQSFDRPAGKLPARWIVTSFVKFVSTLAPQLEATLDGDRPRFLTPLVATAHTVMQGELDSPENQNYLDYHPEDLESHVEEPSSKDTSSLMIDAERDLSKSVADTTDSGISGRMKVRKKVYNAIAAQQSPLPKFDLKKQYTFEFYQHLLDFGPDELAVDMCRPIGKIGLANPTDGQPLKFMSAHRDPETDKLDTLWSFDIWHKSLYENAERAAAD